MGLLDGIGLLVVILLAIAGCSYCYSRCCHRSRTRRNPRPKRHRRQKNARRKRRRHRYQRNDDPNSRPPPNAAAAQPPPSQCNVSIYPEPPAPQGLMFPQQFPSQVHAPPPQYPHFQGYHNQFPVEDFSPGGPIQQAGHTLYGQLPPPPYDFHQPQGQLQNFPQHDTSFFAQSPPPPYDTQLCPQPQQNRQFEHDNKKC